ncbi:hypothetical protein ACFXD5_17510 [Streptomyces sp. NPDC059385]|uniref:hypothetical protein n=1 Tax=Streptomyces sp. NPDC059385 TaxID=3346817 RepID=UPI0036BB8520
MRKARFSLAGVFMLAAAVTLTGCGEEKKKEAAPQLPERTCFGVFTQSDLEPLLGTGETVKVDSPADVRLTAQRPGATCNVYVDGKGRVLVTATRKPSGQSITWPPMDQNQPAPDSLPLGDKGIVWNTGARVAVTCKGSKDSFELELGISGSTDQMKPGTSRPLFTGLMTKYLDAAKQQTGCGV